MAESVGYLLIGSPIAAASAAGASIGIAGTTVAAIAASPFIFHNYRENHFNDIDTIYNNNSGYKIKKALKETSLSAISATGQGLRWTAKQLGVVSGGKTKRKTRKNKKGKLTRMKKRK
jgi:hypothetical protein